MSAITGIRRNLARLRPMALWSAMTRQPASFWLISLYLFFEYVRPQNIYRQIPLWPYSQTILILALVSFLLEGGRFRRFNIADAGLLVFTGVLLLSSVTAYYPAVSRENFELFFSWFVVYVLITNIVVTFNRYLLFLLGLILWSFKMSQHGTRGWAQYGFSFMSYGMTGGPGWFHNSGEFAIQMAIFFPLAVWFVIALKPFWSRRQFYLMIALLPFTAAISILASTSRGGQLAGVGVVLVMVTQAKKKAKGLLWGAVALGLALVAVPPQQWERFSAMGTDETSVRRIQYWKDGLQILEQNPVLGIGYANWLPYYRQNYNPEGELVHNVFLQAAVELGYVGFAAFLFLLAVVFLVNRRTRKRAAKLGDKGRFMIAIAFALDAGLVGFLIAGSFVTVLYYPFLWIQLALTVSLNVVAERTWRAARRAVRSAAAGGGAPGLAPAPVPQAGGPAS